METFKYSGSVNWHKRLQQKWQTSPLKQLREHGYGKKNRTHYLLTAYRLWNSPGS
jgi:hypothetical protein